ncbi:MAG: hypothetical protein OXI01_23340 [Albidovulum sp.]|nr:hypothetical protein [Albidovulum sp.]
MKTRNVQIASDANCDDCIANRMILSVRQLDEHIDPSFFHAFEVPKVLALTIRFFAGPWQSFCVASTRQRLFELRDRLFSLALDGRIEFDDPVYRATRDWLDGRNRRADGNIIGVLIAFLIAHRGNVP